ncbi:hypothetical protein GCM10028796_57860 [Ramlibacter monticola]|uniref:Uncharacterized protein n=1 Tax=Ramlibacter monticola TaxID=1926872 RepID=A0A937CST9_9BURK|nr:hypothetical protein [Ramlibacter monticola]MBL0391830.1 hypothetical protein [Ramlibacter monticola]
MQLNVKQRGDHVATFRWIEVRCMEMLARWVPMTPETEVKLAFGTHIWDLAQHADSLGKRTHELRLPAQYSLEPASGYVRFLSDLAETSASDRRVAAFYDCLLPALERRYRDYLGRVDSLLDGPTLRIIDHILFDLARMKTEGQALREELPAVASTDAAWLDALRRHELEFTEIVVGRPAEQAAAA